MSAAPMIQSHLENCRVLPVVTAHDVETTVRLTRTLLQGGMRAVEITLRTEAALDSIRAVKAEVPDALVAAGTVTNPDDLGRAMDAGADFCVSPGLTVSLLHAASEAGVDFVPGVATASEIMLGMDYGYRCFKLFPAVAVGGMDLIKSLHEYCLREMELFFQFPLDLMKVASGIITTTGPMVVKRFAFVNIW